MREITVTGEYGGMRLDRFVSKTCDVPKSAVQRLIRTGKVKRNGKKTSAEARVAPDDVILVYAEDAQPRAVAFTQLPAPQIAYEDELILAAVKPPALATQPFASPGQDCLTERVKYYLKDEIMKYDGAFAPGAVGRLDTNTSGLVLFAKTPAAAAALSALSRSGKITKKYYVLVRGEFAQKEKSTHWAVKDAAINKMSVFDEKAPGRLEMTTVYEPLVTKGGVTLLSALLITGRTHQIRAQLAHMGFPVAGDMKYGDAAFNASLQAKSGLTRQFLHCAQVSFPAWYSAGTIRLISLPDGDLAACAEKFVICIPQMK